MADASYGDFLKWGYPQSSSILNGIFPCKASSYGGTPMAMETSICLSISCLWLEKIRSSSGHCLCHTLALENQPQTSQYLPTMEFLGGIFEVGHLNLTVGFTSI